MVLAGNWFTMYDKTFELKSFSSVEQYAEIYKMFVLFFLAKLKVFWVIIWEFFFDKDELFTRKLESRYHGGMKAYEIYNWAWFNVSGVKFIKIRNIWDKTFHIFFLQYKDRTGGPNIKLWISRMGAKLESRLRGVNMFGARCSSSIRTNWFIIEAQNLSSWIHEWSTWLIDLVNLCTQIL